MIEHATEVFEDHAAVLQVWLATRAVGVVLVVRKLSPAMDKTPPSETTVFCARAKLTAGAGGIRRSSRISNAQQRSVKNRAIITSSGDTPSYENVSVIVPTTPPTVTTSGSATLPIHTALVDDAHDVVEHSAEPSRPDGVQSAKAKFSPITERLLVTCEAAIFRTAPRVLSIGAIWSTH